MATMIQSRGSNLIVGGGPAAGKYMTFPGRRPARLGRHILTIRMRRGYGGNMDQPTTDVIQGTLDMLILKTLSLEPMHGFGIARRVEQISRGGVKVNPGSLLRSEEHTSELQSPDHIVCRLLL